MATSPGDDDGDPLELAPDQVSDAWVLGSLAEALAEVALAGFAGRERDEVLPEELSERQREVVAFLARHRLPVPWSEYGLAHTVGLDRLLGIAPAGPLDRRIELDGKHWPIWRWLRGLRRGEVDEAALDGALRDQLTPFERYRVAVDIVSGAFRGPGTAALLREDQVGFLLGLVEPDREALVEPLKEHAERLFALPRRSQQRLSGLECALVAVPLVRRARDRGEVPDPRLDDALLDYVLHLDSDLGREILAALPFERREARVLRVIPGRVFSTMYLALCPTPAVAAHTVRNVVGGGDRLPRQRVVEAFVALGAVAVGPIEEALRSDPVNADLLREGLAAIQRRS